MTGRTVVRNHEGSLWLRQVAAELLARLDERGLLPVASAAVVVAPIHPARPGEREDRTCDRCRTWVRPGDLFFPFTYAPVTGVMLTGGLCQTCVTREWPDTAGATS